MNMAEKERLIAKISCNKILATINIQDGQLIQLFLRPPTPDEQVRAASIYDTQYDYGILLGLLSENDVICSLINLGQWSEQLEFEIEGLKQDIHTIRRGLLDFVFNTTKLEQARKMLRNAEKALIERLSRRNNLTQISAEANAILHQQRFTVGRITEKLDGELLWPTEAEFEQGDNSNLIMQLCEIYFYRSRIATSVIRELARSQQWRVYWDTAKHNGVLFDGSIVSWSYNQRELAHWSSLYDSVYSAYERPSEDIINDDDLLDSWFIRQGEKIKDKSQKIQDLPKGKKNGRNEVFVMSDQDGAKKVYDMNDPTSRAKIRAKQQLLQKHGNVAEQNMPDSQREMKSQFMDMRKTHVKSINQR